MTRLRILVTNDDGIDAPGIKALCAALQGHHDLTVVAPAAERSGFSCAITLHKPLRVQQVGDNRFAVSGTPADCTHLGLRRFMVAQPPDLVISGINRGPNLGDDTLFSGTVGAATVAALDQLPAMAVSMGDFAEPMQYDTAATVVLGLIRFPELLTSIAGRVLNINVPNVAVGQLRGVKDTLLGKRYYPGHFDADPQDPELCRYGRGPVGHDHLSESDVTAIENQMVSLTRLKPHLLDVNAYEEEEKTWLPTFAQLLPSAP